MRTPSSVHAVLLLVVLSASACGAREGTGSSHRSPPAPVPAPVVTAGYEVHEWGLVRGGANDSIELGASVPYIQPMPVAKPILYFHLTGAEPVDLRVTARMGEGGTIVETWPLAGAAGAREASWSARVTRGSCHHGRLPRASEAPCLGLTDGCEAATLSQVESDDADCVMVGAQSANHLFYRGSMRGVDPLPLVAERLAGGRVRVRNRGTETIPGVLIRVRRANGTAGVTDAASWVVAPRPGAQLELDAPTGATAAAAAQVGDMLRALGLTDAEAGAFRRAWDPTLFNVQAPAGVQTIPPIGPFGPTVHPVRADAETDARNPVAAASPMALPRPTEALVYFLPPRVIERLSTLDFSPRPTGVKRAIAVWLDLPTP